MAFDDDAFLDLVRQIEGERAILLSGGDSDMARYSIAAWDPVSCFRSKGKVVEIRTGEDEESEESEESFEGDPLSHFDEWLVRKQRDIPFIPPFSGGAIGYFAYELKNQLERLPQGARDDLELPDIWAFVPRRILVHDRKKGTIEHFGPPLEEMSPKSASFQVSGLKSNFGHEDYLGAIRTIKEAIRAGEVYQVNLSQRFEFCFEGSPFALWERLYRENPAPFFAFLDAGDHQILSTSMERFLFRRGPVLETRPIKGTRPRSEDEAEDERLRLELQIHPKDDAELSMIVDLLRNDLGKLCDRVEVTEHKSLEAFRNVFHLHSVIEGKLPPGILVGKILRATFPGGSITGCPKIRAMEIIDEREPCVRHVYTGAIGYLGWHENLDLNVAIRTVILKEGRGFFSVGGGIVDDSEEEAEYEETLHKGESFWRVLEERK